jgi:hypothetical protein
VIKLFSYQGQIPLLLYLGTLERWHLSLEWGANLFIPRNIYGHSTSLVDFFVAPGQQI